MKRARSVAWAIPLIPLVVLGTIVVPNLTTRIVCPQSNIARIDMVGLAAALDEHAIANDGRYPDSLEDLLVSDEHGERVLDLDAVPVDPWGREYRYEPAPDRRSYRLGTLGEDGLPGGEGEAADLDVADCLPGTDGRRAGNRRPAARSRGTPPQSSSRQRAAPVDHAEPLRVGQPPSEQPAYVGPYDPPPP